MIEYKEYIISRLLKEGINEGSNFRGVIFGTGVGAEYIYNALKKMGVHINISAFIDENSHNISEKKFGIPIINISEMSENISVIFVGAKYSYTQVHKKILEHLRSSKKQNIRIINVFNVDNSAEAKVKYVDYIEKRLFERSTKFVEYDETEYKYTPGDSKVISWYLPQYYPIDVNDEFHGLGFTEWTNSSQAFPQYVGHYQPHIPYDLGYYDLRNKETIARQAELANHYGIYGFCIHYYWFDGRKILDEPIKLILANKDINIKFCLNWATEDWTMAWDDGYERAGIKRSILKQNLPKEPERFMEDIIPYMKDKRYIKVNGAPVLSIYKYDIFQRDDFINTINDFRSIAKREGFPDLYVICATGSGVEGNCKDWGG